MAFWVWRNVHVVRYNKKNEKSQNSGIFKKTFFVPLRISKDLNTCSPLRTRARLAVPWRPGKGVAVVTAGAALAVVAGGEVAALALAALLE